MGKPRLRMKTELNYRRGSTAHYCSQCNFYVSKFDVKLLDGTSSGIVQPRCRVIGLRNSRRYRINPDGICDKYDNSKYMSRLLGCGGR
jgi:hypothetical protein